MVQWRRLKEFGLGSGDQNWRKWANRMGISDSGNVAKTPSNMQRKEKGKGEKSFLLNLGTLVGNNWRQMEEMAKLMGIWPSQLLLWEDWKEFLLENSHF